MVTGVVYSHASDSPAAVLQIQTRSIIQLLSPSQLLQHAKHTSGLAGLRQQTESQEAGLYVQCVQLNSTANSRLAFRSCVWLLCTPGFKAS